MRNLLLILTLLAAFPTGYLLAYLARDELVSGRKWFVLLAIASVVASLPVAFYSSLRFPIILALFFIAIISLLAAWKSYDKKWVKKRT